MSDFYLGKRVLVTGGHGFVAAHVVPALQARGALVTVAVQREAPLAWAAESEVTRPRVVHADLRDRGQCLGALHDIDLVFHLAAVGWGFQANLRRAAEVLSENLLLNTNMLNCAKDAGVTGYLYTSSSSVYPEGVSLMSEDLPWDAPPHPGEAPLGWAKRVGEVQARLFHETHGMPVAIVRPTNPYGPWDCLDEESSHVIPALIQRALAGEDPFTVWGTGVAVRSFVHVRDVAQGMLAALEHHAVADPVNLCSPETTSIAELVRIVLECCDWDVPIHFDTSKPDGPPRKWADATKMQERLGITNPIPLEEGIAETMAWIQNQERVRA